MGRAVGSAIEGTCTLIDEVAENKSVDLFLTKKNAGRVAQLAMIGIGTGLLIDAVDGDDATAASSTIHSSDLSDVAATTPTGLNPNAVDNGMFVGDSNDLQALIAAGEQPDSVHVDAEDVERDPAVREAFLAMHGYDGTPEGYEVHHIQPVSEGGADSTDNMILVSEEDHDTITAAHRSYYGWNS